MSLKRVGPDHPSCCQRQTPTGNCDYQAVPGGLYCALHGGSGGAAAEERRELRNFKLNSAFAGRAKELGNSPAIKNLTDEIALMRTALEVIFNSIKSEHEMLVYSDKIEKLTKGIQNLIESLQKMQEKNKELMSRDRVMQIFDDLMTKIVERVSDPDVIAHLANDSFEIISKM